MVAKLEGAMDLVQILVGAMRIRASDIHLSAGSPPLARVDGDIVDIPGFPVLDAEKCKAMIYGVLAEGQRARLEAELGLDASFGVSGVGRFRINAFHQRGCVEAALRLIPSAVPTPESLGLGPTIMSLADLPRGLVLVTGPTGGGKSTTLACLVERVNANRRKHIITIEDPIEFVYERRKALIRQREIGRDARSFEEALRHALREDPDMILVGEMRDPETLSLALTAAETGHLCLSTLHTLDAAQTVERIIDSYPSHKQQQVRQQLSGALKAVVSQFLLPRRGGLGRIAARELMLVTPAIANLIRESKTHMIGQAIETGGASGMFAMDRVLTELVKRQAVDYSEALARARSPERFASALGRAQEALA